MIGCRVAVMNECFRWSIKKSGRAACRASCKSDAESNKIFRNDISYCFIFKMNNIFNFCKLGINCCIFVLVLILIYNLMKTGTVKFFNVSKGFGFITVDDTNQELFVHVTGLVDQIRDGDKVTFEEAEGKKGLNAVNVKKA